MKIIKRVLFTISSIVLFSACNLIGIFNDDEPDQTKDYKVVKVMPLDNKGGVIETEDVSFTIPANTLTSSTELRILESDKNDISPNQVSNGYILSGLPQSFKGAVRIKLKYNKALSNQTFISTVHSAKHPKFDEYNNNYEYYEAKDSSGYLIATIYYNGVNQEKSILKSAVDNEIVTVAISGTEIIYSAKEPYFKVVYNPAKFSDEKAKVLVEALEKSYALFNDIGYKLKERKFKNYLQINVEEYRDLPEGPDGRYGYYCTGWLSCYISINSKKMTDNETIKATATHELFHYIQYLYNVDDFNKTYWIQEALSTWSEELIQDKPETYIPTGFSENIKRAFHGVEAGQRWEDKSEMAVDKREQFHGYGMSGFIKYLVNNSKLEDKRSFTLNLLLNLEQNIANLESFKLASGANGFTALLHEYFNQIMQGEVYGKNNYRHGGDVRTSLSQKQAEGKLFEIKTKADSMKNFSVNIENLGASVFRANLQREFTKEEILKLKFTTSGEFSDHRYYVYKGVEGYFPVLIAAGQCSSNEVIIHDIKSISEEKHPDVKMLVDKPSILVLITNVDESKDVFGSTNFTLDLKVTQEKKEEYPLSTKSLTLKSTYDYYDREEEGRNFWKVANVEIEVKYDLTGYGADIDPDNSDGFVIQFNGKLATIKATGKVIVNPIKLQHGTIEGSWTQYSFGSPKVEFKSHSESEQHMTSETMQDNQYVGTFLAENFYKLIIGAQVTIPLIEERYRDNVRVTRIERNLYYAGEACVIGYNLE